MQGLSTRKVHAITKALCGYPFSVSSISGINPGLDIALSALAGGLFEEPYPDLVLDACYERVREAGVMRSQVVLMANWHPPRGSGEVLALELAPRVRGPAEAQGTGARRHRVQGLRRSCGSLQGSDRSPGEAALEHSDVHFLSNTLDDLPRQADDDGWEELRWLDHRRDPTEAQHDPENGLAQGSGTCPKLTEGV